MRLALPGERVEFPIAIAGSGDSLAYQWVNAVDRSTPEPERTLTGGADDRAAGGRGSITSP